MQVSISDSLVLVIDIQDKLLAKIPTREMLVTNTSFLLDVANLVDVPVRTTEQYPKGIGPTTQEIAKRLRHPPLAKTAFSGCGTILEDLRNLSRSKIILTGMEAHVCVLQTALDLLAAEYSVFLAIDALASRRALDAEVAIRRLERAGAVPTTVESVGFAWLRDSSHPRFKEFSKLIMARDEQQKI